MATRTEQINLAFQAIALLASIMRDGISNATGALTIVTADNTRLAEQAAVEVANCNAYIALLGRLRNITQDTTATAKLTAGVTALNGDMTEMVNTAQSLRTSILAYKNADMSTVKSFTTAANAFIAVVPTITTLW